MRLTVRVTAIVFLILWASSQAGASDERWNSARDHAKNGRRDFAFLDYKAFLKDNADGRRAREARFALGEYHFEHGDLEQARRSFSAVLSGDSPDALAMLSEAYLLQCARRQGDSGAALSFEESLKDLLSSKRFFRLFGGRRPEKWTSPLGNHFRFREDADRMEIDLNEKNFYTIVLP